MKFAILKQMTLGVDGQIGHDVVFDRVMELLSVNVYVGTLILIILTAYHV